MQDTGKQFDEIVAQCQEVFEKKTVDYGTAWRILRVPSVTDQIFIKAKRIRSIQETGVNKVGESVADAFMAIVNYSIMALIQLDTGVSEPMDNPMHSSVAIRLYKYFVDNAKMLMMDKNHDYGEAWRKMRVSSLTDIILMKLMRIKQIEDNDSKTIVSEGLPANYYDIINYAVFALIKINRDTEVNDDVASQDISRTDVNQESINLN